MSTPAVELGTELESYRFGWSDPDDYVFKPKRGLSREVVEEISFLKSEPKWMRDLRIRSYEAFLRRPMPTWGGDLGTINFDDIFYFVRATEKQANNWEDLPADIKNTYDRLGIPEAEKQRLIAGVAAQYECLRGDARVWTTTRGMVPIKEIEAGDTVFALDESTGQFIEAPVRSQAMTDVREVYAVVVGERVIHATDNHPLLVATEGSERAWKTVGELAVGDLIAVPRRLPVAVGATVAAGGAPPIAAGLPVFDIEGSVHDDLGFARVTSITAAGIAPVYDIEIDGPHNFIAEGLVVHNSEVVYHKIRADLEEQGVLFLDTDTALKTHEDLFREHFTTVIPPNDNKLAALNTAVWSGGSFIWIPPGVKVDVPLQAYFRINKENMGQFERTLIIAEPGSYVHYVEGCTAPIYSSDSLHSAVVEIIVKPGARVRYTTIQNWSKNVYNLVTKRAIAQEDATMEWIDANIGCLAEGSRVTTTSGPKPIEQLTPGEQVLSYDESSGELVFRTVLAKKYSGDQPVREVSVGTNRIRVTDNHPFFSYTYDPSRARKSGRYALGYVRADALTQALVPTTSLDYGEPHKLVAPERVTVFSGGNQYSEGYTVSRSRAQRLFLPEQTTDDLMWLLGLYVGDGSIDLVPAKNGGHRSGRVTFSVPATDRARTRLVEVMADLAPTVVPTERGDGVTLTWNSVELAEFFLANGFDGDARTKRVPTWVLGLPETQRASFVSGYADADGCAPKGRRGLSFKSVSRALLEDVADVLMTLGLVSHLTTESAVERRVIAVGRPVTSRGAHRLEVAADPRILAFASDGLQAAAARQLPAKLRHRRAVGRSSIVLPESIELRTVHVSEPVETVPTWDIEVEGTGNFVAEGFIVHNSKLTMKYPSVWLMGRGAKGEVLSVAYADSGQHQDAGAKMVHHAPDTYSKIVSKSISKGTGRTSYRGLVSVEEGAHRVRSSVRCDALMLDDEARSDTYPYMAISEDDATVEHEATVSKIGDDQLFYLQSRGLAEDEATGMIVRGFVEPISRELPMEYAVELNRLIALEMEGSVG